VGAALRAAGIRSTVDLSSDPIGAKVKSAGLLRIPYVLVVGDMEAADKTVAISVRDRSKGGGKYYTKDVTLPVDAFIQRIKQEIDDRIS
jgi:threonyl-tRNA synthetase